MNIINKIIAAIIIIFCNSFCFAQYQPSDSQRVLMQRRELAVSLKSINKVPYIFEGNVTQQECYYSKEGEMLTCTVFQITKIFKGSPQIKLGSIKVITMQEGLIDAGPGISGYGTYIIFGRPTGSSKLNDKITTDNLLTLDCFDRIDFLGNVYLDLRTRKYLKLEQIDSLHINDNMILYYRPAAQWGLQNPTKFKTLDELYAFLKEKGLTVQEEVAQPQQPTSPADTTKIKVIDRINQVK
jgi:hypothetical protein